MLMLQFCEENGGYLAEILWQSEQSNLAALLNIGPKQHYWFGLSDLDYEGKFEWQHSFTPLGEYNNWAPDRPWGDAGDCVALIKGLEWGWGNWHCDHNLSGSEEIHALCQY